MPDNSYNIFVRNTDGWMGCNFYGDPDTAPPECLDTNLYTSWISSDDQITYNNAVAFYRDHTTNAIYTIDQGILTWELK